MKFRVMRSYRPRLFRKGFAAADARIRRQVVLTRSAWTGRMGGGKAGADVEGIFGDETHCENLASQKLGISFAIV